MAISDPCCMKALHTPEVIPPAAPTAPPAHHPSRAGPAAAVWRPALAAPGGRHGALVSWGRPRAVARGQQGGWDGVKSGCIFPIPHQHGAPARAASQGRAPTRAVPQHRAIARFCLQLHTRYHWVKRLQSREPARYDSAPGVPRLQAISHGVCMIRQQTGPALAPRQRSGSHSQLERRALVQFQ
jgi:hypothetical protein